MNEICQRTAARGSVSNWLGNLGWLIILGYVIFHQITNSLTDTKAPIPTSPDFLPAIAHVMDVKIAIINWAAEYQDNKTVYRLIVDCVWKNDNDDQILNALFGEATSLNPKGVRFIDGNEADIRRFWARIPISCLAREKISKTPLPDQGK